MSIRSFLFAAALGFAVLLSTSESTLIPGAHAQSGLAYPDSIKSALEKQTGKRTKLRLVSGQDLEGKVLTVGSEVVVIGELTGMEFFGATVRIDQVAAVIVRTQNP